MSIHSISTTNPSYLDTISQMATQLPKKVLPAVAKTALTVGPVFLALTAIEAVPVTEAGPVGFAYCMVACTSIGSALTGLTCPHAIATHCVYNVCASILAAPSP